MTPASANNYCSPALKIKRTLLDVIVIVVTVIWSSREQKKKIKASVKLYGVSIAISITAASVIIFNKLSPAAIPKDPLDIGT
jgi:hypothetical protein